MQQFSERQVNDVVVVDARGAIDMLTAPQLQDVISDVVSRQPTGLIVDMTRVDFLGSAGMQVLMTVRNQLSPDTRFAVVAEGPATSRLLKITGVADYIEMFSTIDVALTNFAD